MSASCALGWVQALACRVHRGGAESDRSCAKSQSPPTCAKSPSEAILRAVRNQRFVVRSTSRRLWRANFLPLEPFAVLGPPGRPSSGKSRRGRGRWGGRHGSASSADDARHLARSRHGHERPCWGGSLKLSSSGRCEEGYRAECAHAVARFSTKTTTTKVRNGPCLTQLPRL